MLLLRVFDKQICSIINYGIARWTNIERGRYVYVPWENGFGVYTPGFWCFCTGRTEWWNGLGCKTGGTRHRGCAGARILLSLSFFVTAALRGRVVSHMKSHTWWRSRGRICLKRWRWLRSRSNQFQGKDWSGQAIIEIMEIIERAHDPGSRSLGELRATGSPGVTYTRISSTCH